MRTKILAFLLILGAFPVLAQTPTLSIFNALFPLLKCTTATVAAPQFLTYNGAVIACVAAPTVTLPVFVTGETPGGTINGTNTAFTLANTPVSGSLSLYVNGLRMCSGTCNGVLADYSVSGAAITFAPTSTPQVGAVILADYRH